MNNDSMLHDISAQKSTPHIQINILGRFELRVQGQLLDKVSRSLKLRNVLCYLALHRDRSVSQMELIETFWEQEVQSNPLAALKMQISRIRDAFKPLLGGDIIPIVSRSGSYQWNPKLQCSVDVEEFELLYQEAERTSHSIDERMDMYARVIEMYRSPDLGKDRFSWAVLLSSRCQRTYLTVVKKYASLLEAQKKYAKLTDICLRALETEPTNEDIHILILKALLKQNKQGAALKHYKNAANILFRDLGVYPSQELQDLYTYICKGVPTGQASLDEVMTMMRPTSQRREAFFCSFEQFTSIYQLEVRRAMRNGGCLHVAMITLTDDKGAFLTPKINDVVAEQVQKVIVSTVRQSDVVAKFSPSQFIIMLPNANLEDSAFVVERILNAYYLEYSKSLIRLNYQIREMELL